MAEIKVEKVTLDKLEALQKLSIDTFRETFGFSMRIILQRNLKKM